MALIKCPECGREISDKAKACPGCGFPIESQPLKNYDIILNAINPQQRIPLIGFIRMLTDCDVAEGKQMTENLPKTILFDVDSENAHNIAARLTSFFGCEVSIKEHDESLGVGSNVVKKDIPATGIICPRCGSTSVTTGERGFSLFTGFLGSNKTVNRCGKCGYSWEP